MRRSYHHALPCAAQRRRLRVGSADEVAKIVDRQECPLEQDRDYALLIAVISPIGGRTIRPEPPCLRPRVKPQRYTEPIMRSGIEIEYHGGCAAVVMNAEWQSWDNA